jgi:beta-glucosidase
MDGIIVPDGGATECLVRKSKYFPDMIQASAASILCGETDIWRNQEAVTGAIEQNLIKESDLDYALRGVFRVHIRLGVLDPPDMVPYSKIGDGDEPWNGEKHKTLALRITRESIVLLKNNGLLPLDTKSFESIAVIGPRADEVYTDWYGGVPPYAITPLAGIRNRFTGKTVLYAENNEYGEAVSIARSCDVAIVCVGNHPYGGPTANWGEVSTPSEGREAVDRQSIDLEQEELIKQVYQANPNTVVVLVSSFPYAINWTQENMPAIVHITHNSQEEGSALADILSGDYNPAGRLVQTWPKSIEDLPPMMDYDIRHGRTYMYSERKPLYPFGFGLSYTSFDYSNINAPETLDVDGSIDVTFDIKNTGARAGDEVAQLYVRHLNSSVERPLKELKGFQRIPLEPSQTKTVTIALKASDLVYWNVDARAFVVEKDNVQLLVGGSSVDIRLQKDVAVR